jgi:hypothetical protein
LRAESNDILNSPAFLQRKFEVLQADLQKAEDALAAAQQRLEEGKAEWGPQLADLQTEVSSICERKNCFNTNSLLCSTKTFKNA